uniref:Uncharacterized protein n=1 Tax=Cucumis melo TaxID=3656 RepID=A0A9I9E730_CUCME
MGQHSPPSTQPSGQKPLHAPPLSGAWAYASPSVNLTAHPIRFYASSPVQPSHPSGHPPPHAPPITAGQQPSKLSNLYSSTNLSVDHLQQPFFYRNGADQHHNRSGIEAGESSAPSNYGQPYVRGLGINQTYRRTTSSPALNAITQPDISQSLGLMSVDGTNLWILDSGATDHLTTNHSFTATFTFLNLMLKTKPAQPTEWLFFKVHSMTVAFFVEHPTDTKSKRGRPPFERSSFKKKRKMVRQVSCSSINPLFSKSSSQAVLMKKWSLEILLRKNLPLTKRICSLASIFNVSTTIKLLMSHKVKIPPEVPWDSTKYQPISSKLHKDLIKLMSNSSFFDS